MLSVHIVDYYYVIAYWATLWFCSKWDRWGVKFSPYQPEEKGWPPLLNQRFANLDCDVTILTALIDYAATNARSHVDCESPTNWCPSLRDGSPLPPSLFLSHVLFHFLIWFGSEPPLMFPSLLLLLASPLSFEKWSNLVPTTGTAQGHLIWIP